MDDEPQIRMAPGSIVSMVNDQTPHFVLQSPKEIRELRAVLKEENDLGLGEGGGADESGLMNLVGPDLYGDGDVEGYDLAVHPAWLLTVKQVTPRAWMAHQVSVGVDPEQGVRFEEVERRRAAGTPGFIQYLMAAGVPVEFVGPGRYGITLDTSEGVIEGGSHMADALPLMTTDLSPEDDEQLCCCGHPAHVHTAGSSVIEMCQVCGPQCGIFHRHQENEDDERDEQTEEQPAS